MQTVQLISNGDFRDSAGVVCWTKQEETLKAVEGAFQSLGVETNRPHPYKADKQHGFVTTQAEGLRIMADIDPEAPIAVVICSWVYAHHLVSAFKRHQGPILLLANFDGTWPGLVALLNHAGTYERMNVPHSRIWSDNFQDDAVFMKNLKTWVDTGKIEYSAAHVTSLDELKIPDAADALGKDLAADILKNKRLMGQLDPGCMGMLNAVLSPDKMAEIGMPVELLNQSDLLAEMAMVDEGEARANLDWLQERNLNFQWGTDNATELTDGQVMEQMKMYIAAGRIYERFGLSAIGIPYQVGLVRCCPASDLCEGMWNNTDRPDIKSVETGNIINAGKPIVHFNEGDLGSGMPQTLMHDILQQKGMPPETTLHDVRWGGEYDGKFVWVFEISGGAPPAHWDGWGNTTSYRQPPMYFEKGGGTCSGVYKPGVITWARLYQSWDELGLDVGTGEVIELPDDELKMRQDATTKEWPIANVHIPGYGRDELMATHRSNHITVCYGDICAELAAVGKHIGLKVNVVGDARKAFV
jgi:hypothetical protein